jgi:hypothetical protein
MILRRVTLHVKSQNWFAVGIDFVIVVLGVFIGIQIGNWNEDRLVIKDEQVMITRLADDFGALELLLIQRVDRAESLVRSTSSLVSLVREASEPLSDAVMQEMLRNTLRYNAAVSQPTSFSEALQSGQIAKLRDHELRRRLYEYEISSDWWTAVSGPANAQIDPQSRLYQAITISADSTPEASIKSRVIEFDWPGVMQAERELSAIHSQQSFQAEAYRLELVGVRNVLNALENTR